MNYEFGINGEGLNAAIAAYNQAAEEFNSICGDLDTQLAVVSGNENWKTKATADWTAKVDEAKAKINVAKTTMANNATSLTQIQGYAEQIETDIAGTVSGIQF